MEWPAYLSPEKHFATADLIRSATAEARGIDNRPPDDLLGNATRLVALCEQARAILGKAAGREVRMVESSGFRCLTLNKAVGGSGSHPGEKVSAHCFFRALDFHTDGWNLVESFHALKDSDLPFDKLIYEIDHNGAAWLHLQVGREGATPAGIVLRGVKTPNGSSYVELPR